MDQRVQVLREIDKLDKIGLDGVCSMLGDGLRDASGAFNKGVGLMPVQVGIIRLFLTETTGHDSNEKTLAALKTVMLRLGRIRGRIDLMCALEESADEASGLTAWDKLLAMPTNKDNTWSNGGRPGNVGWALDDMLDAIRSRRPTT